MAFEEQSPPDPSLQRFEFLAAYARAGRLPWRVLDDGRKGELHAAGCCGKSEARRPFPLRAAAHVSRRRFQLALQRRFRDDLVDASVSALRRASPQASAYRLLSFPQAVVLTAAAIAAAVSFAAAPLATLVAFNAAATLYFLAAISFRLYLTAVALRLPQQPEPPPVAESDLPTVTILLPVHDEAAGLAGLAAAMEAIDYPRDRLDIKLLVEETDAATLAEARRIGLDEKFDLVVVPLSSPQTKPKACNYALPLARGDLIVIYDAEDAPEPDQLRKAAAAFAAGDETLVCAQARLNYYNPDQNWLTRGIMAQTPVA